MAVAADYRGSEQAGRGGAIIARFAVIIAWAAAALLLALCHLAGFSPNSDLDDLLKLVEIRNVLDTWAWFDRTIQGVLQPEPFVSHWVRLVDLPYAALAASLSPITSRETALSIACYAVPLLLLLPVLYAFRRIVAAYGFQRPDAVFAMSFLFVLPALFEFAPDRIDYHNLELVFLLLAVACAVAPRPPALLIGVLAALTLAISVEFLLFFALLMALFAGSFVLGREDADRQLARFGAGLTGTALVSYAMIIPPWHYGAVACDSYSTPHLLALTSAGLSFIVAGRLSDQIRGPAGRAALLGLCAAASAAVLIVLFPECRAGPYGELSTYVKEQWLFRIGQEKDILHRPNIVLSPDMAGVALIVVGALAPFVFALRDRFRRRELTVLALFSLLAVLHALFYLRYFRYTAFFASPGLMLAFAACAPSLAEKGKVLAGEITRSPPPAAAAVGPGIFLVAGLLVFHLVHQNRAHTSPSGAELASACRFPDSALPEWPQGARLFAPPDLGIHLLAAEPRRQAAIVATPHHPSWKGIERVYRFLDPQTPDPRKYLDQAKATHVVVCAWRGEPLTDLEKAFPLALDLIEGRPPAWLSECPLSPASPIRVYRYPAAGGAASACPTEEGAGRSGRDGTDRHP
ncbi:MAG: hypothetical protein ACTHLC_18905 [Rhizobiaceae bacterium]